MPTATELVTRGACANASTVFVFDSFAAVCPVTNFQYRFDTRPGSAAALLGYIANQSPKSSADVRPIAVLLTPSALLEASSALSALPAIGSRPPIALYVACTEPLLNEKENHMARIPALDKLFFALDALHAFKPTTILAGGVHNGPQDVVDRFESSQDLLNKGQDVLFVWEAIAAGQEQLAKLIPSKPMELDGTASLASASYFGSQSASKALLVPSTLHSSKALAAQTAVPSVGILVANSLDKEHLLDHLPTTVKELYVLTKKSHLLYKLALTTTRSSKSHAQIRVKSLSAPSEKVWSVAEWEAQLSHIAGEASQQQAGASGNKLLSSSISKLAVFWSGDEGKAADLSDRVAAGFSSTSKLETRLYKEYDNYSGKDGGLLRSSLLLAPEDDAAASNHSMSAIVEATAPNLLFLSGHTSILSAYSPLQTINTSTQVVFSASSWTPDEYLEKLSEADRAALASNAGNGNVWTLDVAQVVQESGLIAADGLVEEAAFWHLFMMGQASDEETNNRIADLLDKSAAGGEWSTTAFKRLAELTRKALRQIPFQKAQPAAPAESDAASKEAIKPLPHHIRNTATGPNQLKTFADPEPFVPKAWHLAAKQMMFGEAYETEEDVKRPDLPEENFILTVTENRRLTPLDYDRNVFHMELSTEGTGLKYAVGEALGVHGHNDTAEVLDFLEWFGLDPDAIVQVPGREHARSYGEERTIFQTFQQNIDIFGKPGKSFYEALSKIATNREEARHLRFISSAEGSSTFKKWSENETVTYVDVLKEFPSTKELLGLDGLLREVPLIKPRHYSIASSQHFVGESVHLLVVTVDWMTPAQVRRYGQCTRYLAGLNIGDKVMVSVKPSVMKLPPKDTQPIIMAGLGTGAAPFRAFIQERQWQREQGLDVGPLLYYFGSRYSSKEFLYGEEIKAWLEDGLVTHAGLAFSRDGAKKVYIQHKMKEDGKLIADLLDEGYFYLCGPTWPVPDVYEALCDSQVKHRGKTLEGAQEHLEDLKEKERYVLEVY